MGFVEDRIYALSNSRINTYDPDQGGCPKKAYYKFILKLKEPENDAMARGQRLHKMQQDLIETKSADFPVALRRVEEPLLMLLSSPGKLSAEHQLAFDDQWNLVDWFDSATAWRVVYDAVLEQDNAITIQDLKSGKMYSHHDIEMDRYALTAFMWKPDIDEVTVEYHYCDQGQVRRGVYTRAEDLPPLEEAFRKVMAKIRADRLFAANPSYKCKWCFQRRSAGGKCDHG